MATPDWTQLASAAMKTASNALSPPPKDEKALLQPSPAPTRWKTYAIAGGVGVGVFGVLMLIFGGRGKRKK